MDSIVFVLILLVTAVTRTATLTIVVTSDAVTVLEGEQINLSCSITLDSDGIREFRWYRGSVQTPYGSIDVTNCGVSHLCPEVNTMDNRGVVNYTRGFHNDATLTLVIDHSLVRDNTSFSCGVVTNSHTSKTSDDIYVFVQHLPDPTYPKCLRSNSSTLTDSLFLSCWAEQTQPVVSLEWTVEGSNSERISLSNKTEIVGTQVENNLILNETEAASDSLVFTCHMTSSAFPHTRRNCSIGPILILGDQTTEGVLPYATKTTTPFAKDGNPMTPTADNIPTLNDPSLTLTLNTVVIAAIASACLVVVIILLIIIACLVCSRRKRSRAAPGSNTNLSNEAHFYVNQSHPAVSSVNRPGSFELPPWDKPTPPPSPLYAVVSSPGKNASDAQARNGSLYAVVSKQDKRRGSSPLEEETPNMGQDPPEYHTLDPGTLHVTQGQVPKKSTEDQVVYIVPRQGQGARSLGSSGPDEDEGKLVDNILYSIPNNEYM